MQLGEDEFPGLDDLNAVAFLRGMGVSSLMLERFWSFVCMSILNVPLELCSAAALLRFYKKLAGNNKTVIGLPTKGLGDLFAPQAKDMIEKDGGHVFLKTGVKSFLGHGHKVEGVELESGEKIRSKYVISTLPAHHLRQRCILCAAPRSQHPMNGYFAINSSNVPENARSTTCARPPHCAGSPRCMFS